MSLNTQNNDIATDGSFKPFVGTLVAHADHGILRITHVAGQAIIARVVYDHDGPTDIMANGVAFNVDDDDVELLAQNGPWGLFRLTRIIAVEHRGERLTVHHLCDVVLTDKGVTLQVQEVWDSVNGASRGKLFHNIAPGELTLIDTSGAIVPADNMRVSLPADLTDDADAEAWVEDLDVDLSTPLGRNAEAVDLLRMHREIMHRLERLDHYDAKSAIEAEDDFGNYMASLAMNTLADLQTADLDDRFPMPAAADESGSEDDEDDTAEEKAVA